MIEHGTIAAQNEAMQAEITKLFTENNDFDQINRELSEENKKVLGKHYETVTIAKRNLNEIQ